MQEVTVIPPTDERKFPLAEIKTVEVPKPYAYDGLTVQGVSPYRLTARPNENIEVPDEVGYTIVRRNLARRLIESRIAIATAGLGVRLAGLTVRAHVRAMIISAGLVRVAANIRAREVDSTKIDPTLKPAHPSETVEHTSPTCDLVDDYGSLTPQGQRILLDDVDPSWRDLSDTNEDMDVEF